MRNKLLLVNILIIFSLLFNNSIAYADNISNLTFDGSVVSKHYLDSNVYDNPSNITTDDFVINGDIFLNGVKIDKSDVEIYVPSDELIIYGKQSIELILKVKNSDDYLSTTGVIYVGRSSYIKPNQIKATSTKTTVKLSNSEYYEYSINGIKWQKKSTFKNLKKNKKYTVYYRLKSLDDANQNEIYSYTIKTK